jgi:DNA (cytosine-5)-methyltransferase 1
MSQENFNPTMASLFAGVGGIDLGFHQAGFTPIWANEFDPKPAETFQENFTSNMMVKSITDLDLSSLKKVSVISSGFPCQAFSIAGYRKGFRDPRGQHFFNTMDVVNAVQPDCIMLENVKNLVKHNDGETMQVIETVVKEAGYSCDWKVLNAQDYGVPQNRERVFVVGFRNGITKFEWPEPIPLTSKVHDLLEDNVDDKYYYNRFECYEKIIKEVDDLEAVYQWRRKYTRKNKSGVCPTLTANMGTGGHNVPLIHDGRDIRKLTPRECFRVQGFPDHFTLPNVADSYLYKQAGNSVSVPVIKAVAESIYKRLYVSAIREFTNSH